MCLIQSVDEVNCLGICPFVFGKQTEEKSQFSLIWSGVMQLKIDNERTLTLDEMKIFEHCIHSKINNSCCKLKR